MSALHGRGSGDLLDAVLGALPEAPEERLDAEAGPRRVALIGRPNVGKSSLLNKLAGEDRVLVDPVAGTTRDPVDELIELGGVTWRFVDTAGIRRRVSQTQGHPSGSRGAVSRLFRRDGGSFAMASQETLSIAARQRPETAEPQWSLERVYDIFPRLRERRHQRSETLSGGEQQMLVTGMCR